MMDFISIPITFAVGAYAFYKIVELFVRKKERLLIIDKLSSLEGVTSEKLDFSKLFPQDKSDKGQFIALRFGSLIVGLGLGLMVGYFIGVATNPNFASTLNHDGYYRMKESIEMIYGASTLLFGGLGLVIGFMIEYRIRKNSK